MDIINAFLSHYKANTNVNSTFRSHVYPQVSPNDTLPVVVYQVNDGVRPTNYKGSYGLRTVSLVLNLYGENYDDVMAARVAIENEYNGFSGVLQGTHSVSKIEMTDAFFALENGNDNIYRCTLELDLID